MNAFSRLDAAHMVLLRLNLSPLKCLLERVLVSTCLAMFCARLGVPPRGDERRWWCRKVLLLQSALVAEPKFR